VAWRLLQTLSSVLAECGSDIDAAIRRLNELRLAANSEQAGAANGVPVPAGPAVAGGVRAARTMPASPGAAAVLGSRCCANAPPLPPPPTRTNNTRPPRVHASPAGPANGAAGAPAPQQQQQQQQPPAAPERAGPQTAEQWTDALVAEMAAAKDVPDAKARAAKALTAFEQFVTAHIVAAREREAKDAAGGDRAGASSRLGEVQRENAILKRAVQIQNARIQELSSREAEVAALKQAVGQYQERLKQMELSNYSLALHLSKATGGSGLQPGQRPPDVF